MYFVVILVYNFDFASEKQSYGFLPRNYSQWLVRCIEQQRGLHRTSPFTCPDGPVLPDVVTGLLSGKFLSSLTSLSSVFTSNSLFDKEFAGIWKFMLVPALTPPFNQLTVSVYLRISPYIFVYLRPGRQLSWKLADSQTVQNQKNHDIFRCKYSRLAKSGCSEKYRSCSLLPCTFEKNRYS